MSKFSDRFNYALKTKNKSSAEIARTTKLSTALISQYKTGKFEPKMDKAILLANALNINVNWLMGLSNNMNDTGFNIIFNTNGEKTYTFIGGNVESKFDDKGNLISIEEYNNDYVFEENNDNYMLDTLTDDTRNDKFTNYNFYHRSYISNLSAGSFQELLVDTNSDKVPVPIKFKPFDKRINLFKINGTSMNKVIQDGSIVVTLDNNNNSEVYSNGTIVVVFYNNEATVKRFYDEGEYILLKPDSTDTSHKTIVIQKGVSEFYIIGKVVWHLNPSDMERYYN